MPRVQPGYPPCLLDEGLPSRVADGLRALGLPVYAVGGESAPPRASPDDVNVEWCRTHGAVLITNDRGRKDPVILRLLREHKVGAVFVHRDLRRVPPHRLAYALLRAEPRLIDLASRKNPIRHRLTPTGGLDAR